MRGRATGAGCVRTAREGPADVQTAPGGDFWAPHGTLFRARRAVEVAAPPRHTRCRAARAGGGGQAPQEVAERGARAPFQRALQTAKAVEVTLSSGAGRGERAKRLVPHTANVSDRRCNIISMIDLFFRCEHIRRQSPYGPVVEHLTESAKIDGSSPGATTAFVVLSETHLISATQPAPAATFFLAFFCARSSANGSARVRAGERSRLRALSPGTGSRLRKPNWERSQFPASSREIEGPDRGHSAADA